MCVYVSLSPAMRSISCYPLLLATYIYNTYIKKVVNTKTYAKQNMTNEGSKGSSNWGSKAFLEKISRMIPPPGHGTRNFFSVSEFAIFSKFQKCHSMCYCESEKNSRKIFLRAC